MAFVGDIESGPLPELPPPPRKRGRRGLLYLALTAALVIGLVLLFAAGVGDASAAGGCGG